MFGRYSVNNNVRVALHANINAVVTSLTFGAASGVFNNPADPDGDLASGGVGIASLVDSLTLPTKTEIVTYTTLTNNGDGTYTLGGLTRGVGGTTAKSWVAGGIITQAMVAGMLVHPHVSFNSSDETFYFAAPVEVDGLIGAQGVSLTNPVDVLFGGTGATTAAAARTNLGLGALATLANINNANWSGTDLAVANGGTGASDASGARTNLGVVIGTDVQAYHANLAGFSGIASLLGPGTVADTYRVPMRVGTALGGGWGAITFSAYGTALVGGATLSDMRDTLGLAIGTNVQAYDADLAGIAGIASLLGPGTLADAYRVPALAGTALGGTWGPMTFSGFGATLVGSATQAAMRTVLDLGTAATQNTGTSGAVVPLLNGANTHSAVQTSGVNGGWAWSVSGVTGYAGATSSPAAGSAVGTSSNHPLYGFTNGAVRWTTDATGFNLASGHSYYVNGTKVVGARDTGWTATSGVAANKGANVTVAQSTTLTAAPASYNQAYFSTITTTLNTSNTEINKLSARVRALEEVLRTHGLIN